MIRRLVFLALLAGGCFLLANLEARAPEESPQILHPAPQMVGSNARALAWSFLPDAADQVPGNAASLWLRAGLSERAVRHRWTDKEDKWLSAPPEGVSLMDLPRKEVQQMLDKFGLTFRLAEQAARRTHCDWDYPPITFQNIDILPLEEIQLSRMVVRLLSLRCRLELAEANFPAAHRSLRTGLKQARDIGGSNMLIQDLVGIAVSAIILGRVEEWIQTPGSPNLYWALTELPRPLIDVRVSVRSELNSLDRSFPALRELKGKTLSPEEARTLVDKLFQSVLKLSGESGPEWKIRLATAALAMKYYPTAKRELIALGRSEKEVEALPVPQAVAVYFLEDYDRVRDEILKWMAVPSAQGLRELERIERSVGVRAREKGNFIIGLLLPAISKSYQAQLRLMRQIEGLRTAEAIRLYIGEHGKPPTKLGEITDVPLPLDPFTGSSMEAWYSWKDGKAVLDVPPPPGMPGRLGKRYVFKR